MNTRCQLRRWAAGLTMIWLPLIGIAFAPTGLADPGSNETGPCAFNVTSMACLEWESGGTGPYGPCGWDSASMGCIEARNAADGQGPVPPPA